MFINITYIDDLSAFLIDMSLLFRRDLAALSSSFGILKIEAKYIFRIFEKINKKIIDAKWFV